MEHICRVVVQVCDSSMLLIEGLDRQPPPAACACLTRMLVRCAVHAALPKPRQRQSIGDFLTSSIRPHTDCVHALGAAAPRQPCPAPRFAVSSVAARPHSPCRCLCLPPASSAHQIHTDILVQSNGTQRLPYNRINFIESAPTWVLGTARGSKQNWRLANQGGQKNRDSLAESAPHLWPPGPRPLCSTLPCEKR